MKISNLDEGGSLGMISRTPEAPVLPRTVEGRKSGGVGRDASRDA